jgi:hypothetical protein
MAKIFLSFSDKKILTKSLGCKPEEWRLFLMLRHVAVVRPDVLEELSAYFIRVTIIGELGTTIGVN